MPTKDTTSWICDLCGDATSSPLGCTPTGWIKLTFEDRYLDRSWYEKVICPTCSAKIYVNIKREVVARKTNWVLIERLASGS
jgi:hypothetical protein